MKSYTLKIDNAPGIRFTGELMASVSSQALTKDERLRWTELALYKTQGGKYVCHQIGRTSYQEEQDRFSGKVCATLAEVKDFFGHRWLAKDLYAKAGINDVIEIE